MLPHMAKVTPTRRSPRFTRRQKALGVLLLMLFWSILANQWQSKGCQGIPDSYRMVLTHGTPDASEGCDLEGGYTNRY